MKARIKSSRTERSVCTSSLSSARADHRDAAPAAVVFPGISLMNVTVMGAGLVGLRCPGCGLSGLPASGQRRHRAADVRPRVQRLPDLHAH